MSNIATFDIYSQQIQIDKNTQSVENNSRLLNPVVRASYWVTTAAVSAASVTEKNIFAEGGTQFVTPSIQTIGITPSIVPNQLSGLKVMTKGDYSINLNVSAFVSSTSLISTVKFTIYQSPIGVNPVVLNATKVGVPSTSPAPTLEVSIGGIYSLETGDEITFTYMPDDDEDLTNIQRGTSVSIFKL